MKKLAIGLIVLSVVLLVPLIPSFLSLGGVRDLRAVEVREYMGRDLSSIVEFRENSIEGPQHVDETSYRLGVSGLVRDVKNYTYEQVIAAHQVYRKVVSLQCVEGWSVTILWEGLLVRDLIREAYPLPEAKVVIFHAYDGYTTSFPIEYLMDNEILMAYRMNNVTLPTERGFPFQLVAESKWGYKWIKWITEIELSSDVDYRGYWERRGYSNNGNLDDPFIEEG